MPADWARDQAAQGIHNIVNGIRRDLEIEWREHNLFPSVSPAASSEAFIVMAANPELAAVYREAIEPAIQSIHLQPYLMAVREPTASISNEILSRIEAAKLLVADLTFERPNCYYEVGYAHARSKKVIFTAREDHDPRRPNRLPSDPKVHFDLDSHRISFWAPGRVAELRAELTGRLHEAARSLEASKSVSGRLGEKGEAEILTYFRDLQAGRTRMIVLYDHLISQGLGWPLDEVQLALKRLVEKNWLHAIAGGFSLKER